MILMAKSEIRAMHIWQAVNNLVCQHTGRRDNDLAISIKRAQEPITVTLVRSSLDRVWYLST